MDGAWRNENKLIIVIFDDGRIVVKKLMGLLPAVTYVSSEIDGWKHSLLPSQGGSYEYVYLYRNGKKIAKISEFYHRNYEDVKQYVSQKYKDLGYEKLSYIAEFKEMFD